MRRGIGVGVAVAVMTLTASSCSGSKHAVAPAANVGHAAPAEAPSGKGLTTTVNYSGVFDEKIHQVVSGSGVTQTIDRHQHFSFGESVSLTTTAATLAQPIRGVSPISDSLDNPLTFQLSGTVTEQETSSAAPPQSCAATLSGNSGLDKWKQVTGKYVSGRPPVEIAVDALDPAGGVAKTYGLQISAEVPTTGPHGRAINVNVTKPNGDGYCLQTGVIDSPAVLSSPACVKLAAPGPVDANFLLLPLDTKDYRKTFSCDNTVPYTQPGITGTDTVTGSSTLTVNAKGTTYVALGDSYSSGDFSPYQDQPCGRSQAAYPALYQTDPSRLTFLACLGASSAKIEDTQVPQIPATAKIVSVTAGGDDFVINNGKGAQGLVGPLIDCVYQRQVPLYRRLCAQEYANDLIPQMPTVQSNIEHMLNAVKNKVDNVKIFVLGYPNPFPERFASHFCRGLEETNKTLHDFYPLAPSLATQGLGAWDVGVFHDLITVLNGAVARAAASAGATYVDPTSAFAGHDLCARVPWFFPLGDPNFTEALHPNGEGHQQLAQLLTDAAGPAPQ